MRLLAAESDRGHYTLKGGCNLRLFFKSVRYSEDMDLDVSVVAKTTLKGKVDKLLAGRPLTLLLGAATISVSEVTSPKQTDTTPRWKVALHLDGASTPVRTKIEMSRRPSSGEVRFEAVDRALASAYKVTPPLVSHYTAEAALVQKIEALAGRAEPQARDVFDLHLMTINPGCRSRAPRRPGTPAA